MLAALLCGAGNATAAPASLRFCDRATPLTATQQDRLLRFAHVAQQALQASGAEVALVARSGTDLQRLGHRYSHAGISLRQSALAPWAVRQLYYACDDGRPQLFDQGLAGFVFGTDDPASGHLSLVLLPPEAAGPLARTALDKPRALALVAPDYSANAYAYGLRYQNCNQWVMELLAAAWGGLPADEPPRAAAQAWLARQGYSPPPVQLQSHLLMFAGSFIPWVHYDDHPEADRWALQFRVSMPAAIEAFARARWPAAQRIELCHDSRRVVLHHGWSPLGEVCEPGPGDTVVALD